MDVRIDQDDADMFLIGTGGNPLGAILGFDRWVSVALSPKHRKFCEEYLRTSNATDAYQAAYPKVNRDTARANGARLLANASISEEIQRRVDEEAMPANEVLRRLAEQARAAYSAYMMPNGAVDLSRLIADGKAHLIKGVKETKYGTEIEFYDAQTALVHIGKHHKLFADGPTGAKDDPIHVKHLKGYMEVSPDDWDDNNDGKPDLSQVR